MPPVDTGTFFDELMRLARERTLMPNELTTLARRMVESDDLAEVEKLKTAIARGFYGEAAHA